MLKKIFWTNLNVFLLFFFDLDLFFAIKSLCLNYEQQECIKKPSSPSFHSMKVALEILTLMQNVITYVTLFLR